MSLSVRTGRRRSGAIPSQKTGPADIVIRMVKRIDTASTANRKGNAMPTTIPENAFGPAARDAVYRAIFTRRDVRGEFIAEPLDDRVLARLLAAAHRAPSVGYMQPWNFIVIRDLERRKRIRELFLSARGLEVEAIASEKQELYRALKLEGICESALNLCITCDRSRSRASPLGRWHNPEMDLFSTVCAVQNLWLAARAEGIGVGWVSILDHQALKQLLAIPDNVVPVAYLCVGPVSAFGERPELEAKGWAKRLPLSSLIMSDLYGGTGEDRLKALADTQVPG